MAETTAVRRKRLLLRSRYRGFLEIDLLLAGFAAVRLASLDDDQLDRYERLIDEADHDIYAWVIGQKPAPARHDHDVLALLRAHRHTPAEAG